LQTPWRKVCRITFFWKKGEGRGWKTEVEEVKEAEEVKEKDRWAESESADWGSVNTRQGSMGLARK